MSGGVDQQGMQSSTCESLVVQCSVFFIHLSHNFNENKKTERKLMNWEMASFGTKNTSKSDCCLKFYVATMNYFVL